MTKIPIFLHRFNVGGRSYSYATGKLSVEITHFMILRFSPRPHKHDIMQHPVSEKIRLAIVDPNNFFKNRVLQQIQAERDFKLVINVFDCFDLLEELRTNSTDIILIDSEVLRADWIRAEKVVRRICPEAKIVAITSQISEDEVFPILLLGIKNFIYHDINPSQLFVSLKVVFLGGVLLTDIVSDIIWKSLVKYNEFTERNKAVTITEIEKQLLEYLAGGLSSTEIADRLCKSPRTVEKYRNDLYLKFGVNSKISLIKECLKLGILQHS